MVTDVPDNMHGVDSRDSGDGEERDLNLFRIMIVFAIVIGALDVEEAFATMPANKFLIAAEAEPLGMSIIYLAVGELLEGAKSVVSDDGRADASYSRDCWTRRV